MPNCRPGEFGFPSDFVFRYDAAIMDGLQTLEPTETLADLRRRIEALEAKAERATDSDSLSMCVFSGELDKLMAAFTIACSAAACGMKVSMFFSFWGAAALKKDGRQSRGKTWIEWMFGWMLPGGFARRKLSKLDMGGMGRMLMAREMRRKNIADLPALVDAAREAEVRILVCESTLTLMGIRREELIDYPDMEFCGAARFVATASRSGATLFI